MFKKSVGVLKNACVYAVFSVPCLSFADGAPTDVAGLASSVDFKDVGGAILAIAGSVIALYVTWKGAQFVIKQVRGA